MKWHNSRPEVWLSAKRIRLAIWWDCIRGRHNYRVNMVGVLCCRYCTEPCDL